MKKVFLVSACIMLFSAMLYPPSNEIKHTEIYVVKEGDTLWNIAQEFCEHDNRYINQLIYDITQDNPELSKNHGQVWPGQKLVINLKK